MIEDRFGKIDFNHIFSIFDIIEFIFCLIVLRQLPALYHV
jgi:hypothetical protein